MKITCLCRVLYKLQQKVKVMIWILWCLHKHLHMAIQGEWKEKRKISTSTWQCGLPPSVQSCPRDDTCPPAIEKVSLISYQITNISFQNYRFEKGKSS